MTETVRSRLTLRARLPTTQSAVAVLGGDLLVLFALIAVGQYTHGYLFWEAPARTVLITTPFVIGWLLVSPLAGLYSTETLERYRRTLLFVVPAWVGTSLIGSALRGSELFPGGAPVVFVLVNIGTGLLFLIPWRLFVTWLYNR